MSKLREECGVFGIYNNEDAATLTALGLHALQHRGQEGCGIIAFDGRGGNAKRKRIYKDYKANRANKTRLRRFDHHDSTIEDEQESMKNQFSRLISYLDNLPKMDSFRP